LNLQEEAEDYLRAQRELRLKLYGSSEEAEELALLEKVRERTGKDPESTMCAMLGGEKAGILHMDFDRNAEKGIGHISFCHINEEHRNHGFGIQLIGQAVMHTRDAGGEFLRVALPVGGMALQFLSDYGFYPVVEVGGRIVLEKDIRFEAEYLGE
jgi:GNAT superfamily N-acetyltransferase